MRRHLRSSTALRASAGGFSLIELVIVVVIIGIIGAIAIPRMSRGASGASNSALVANLSVLRNAIDLYNVEHEGKFPAFDKITDQLTKKTDINGNVEGGGASDGGPYIYGPYVRSIPPLPVGAQKGETGFTSSLDTSTAAGWVYDEATGEITANSDASDENDTAYNTY